jgi:hypothetical protein
VLIANIPLAGTGPVYLAALIGQVSFYLLAGYGALLELDGRRAAAPARSAAAERAPSRARAHVREVS